MLDVRLYILTHTCTYTPIKIKLHQIHTADTYRYLLPDKPRAAFHHSLWPKWIVCYHSNRVLNTRASTITEALWGLWLWLIYVLMIFGPDNLQKLSAGSLQSCILLRLIMRTVVESVDGDDFTYLIGAVIFIFFSYSVHVKFTGCTLWTSDYLSTNMPACTAWTILLNLGFSSARRLTTPIFLLNVHASQSRTSLGTLSACKSLSSSSASNRCLDDRQKEQWGQEADAFIYLVVLGYFSVKLLTFPNLFDFLRSWVLSDESILELF